MKLLNFIISLSIPLVAHAEDLASSGDFYPKDAAKTVFVSEVKMTKGLEIGYYKDQAEKVSAEIKNPEKKLDQAVEVEQSDQDEKDPVAKILKEYGDPTAEAAINAKSDAPKPFKAMMAALEAGDEKLAFQYSKQYTRYLNRVQERVNKVTGLVGIAMESQGMLGEDDWQNSPRYAETRSAVAEELELAKLKKEESSVRDLDPKVAAMLDRAKKQEVIDQAKIAKMQGNDQEEDYEPNAKQAQHDQHDNFDEKKARLEVRAAIKASIPADTYGEVDIYFFFRPKDRNSLLILPEVQAVYDKYQAQIKSGKVKFLAVSLDALDGSALGTFTEKNQISFPITSGMSLAKKLEIKGYPTTVFVARNSGKAVYEEGFRRSFYMDEVLGLMQGR